MVNSHFSIAYAAINLAARDPADLRSFSIAYAAINPCVILRVRIQSFSIAYAAINMGRTVRDIQDNLLNRLCGDKP